MPCRAAESRCGRKLALVGSQPRAFVIGGGQNQIAAADFEAGDAIEIVLLRPVDEIDARGNFRPIDRLAGDEVDHARHGVRTVCRGRAVFHHFQPLDCDQRDERVDIDECAAVVVGHRGQRLPPVVEQDQRGAEPEIAQVELGGARCQRLTQLIGACFGAGVGRHRIDQFGRIGERAGSDIFRADHRQRRRTDSLAQQSAGDDDFRLVVRGSALVLGPCGLCQPRHAAGRRGIERTFPDCGIVCH